MPRDVEELIGYNKGRVHWYVDNCHISDSYLSVVRKIRKKLKTKPPRSLWRGVILCALNRHKKNREVYHRVMGGGI